jgi:PAS domain S-box-containing protein
MGDKVSLSEKKRTVLIVDDAPDEIAVLDEILRKDFRLKAATNGASALEIARSDPPPDLILLDVSMPDMDGFEVCRALKQDAAGAMIPVIFLTGRSRASDEKTGFELGAVDYIRKPIDPVILKTRIYSHLESKERTLRESELRYRRFFETAADGILLADARTGIVIDANPALAAMLGLSQEDFLGRKLSDLPVLEGIVPLGGGLGPSSRPRYLRRDERPLETADGRTLFVESTYGLYRVDNRDVVQVSLRDISELALAERERERSRFLLEASLLEKETLLQEIHHRVKNNMQIIISLLHVSTQDIADADIRGKLDDITERLYSMAAIHERFYASEDMSRIDFAPCIRQLADDFKGRRTEPSGEVELDCGDGEVILSLEQAIPAGLLVSEFLSMAAKDAAERGGTPVPSVLRQRLAEGGFVEIELRPGAEPGIDGAEVREEAVPGGEESLGMMLVRALSGQLGADMRIARAKDGFAAFLRFKIEGPAPSRAGL